jgi:hypothetical protein
MAASTDNYYIGKGVVTVKPYATATTLGAAVDLGNVPTFEVTPNIEKLDHFSSRLGTKTKDRSVVITRAMTVRIVMEEWTADNLGLAMLGTVTTNVVEIFEENEIQRCVEFAGANDVGATLDIILYNVNFQPGSSLSPISDEWGSIEITGEALVAPTGLLVTAVDVGGKFGKITVTPPA